MTDRQEPAWSLSAQWVFPIDRPPLKRGVVTIGGERIVAVEPRGSRIPDLDLGNAAILPGLVNAHTHLDLSGLRGKCLPTRNFTGGVARPESSKGVEQPALASPNTPFEDSGRATPSYFTDWLRQVVEHRRGMTSPQVEEDIRAGLTESLTCGVTLLGDISAQGLSWPHLLDAPLRSVVFYEMLGLPKSRVEPARIQAREWLAAHTAAKNCRPGLSPHAPYSVHADLFTGANELAQEFQVPLATHVAETAAELELLERHSGPLAAFLFELGVWEPQGLVREVTEAIRICGQNDVQTLLVHCNNFPPEVPSTSTVIYCPRTHAAFGHPPHPFRDFLARGVRVALGTDSLASNPDLDVLAEARFLHRLYPDFPGAALLRMITLSGAEALGWEKETGSLTPGKSADLVVLPLPDEDSREPHALVFESASPVRRVLWRGQWRE